MAMQISKRRKFIGDGIIKAELNKFHTGELLSTLGVEVGAWTAKSSKGRGSLSDYSNRTHSGQAGWAAGLQHSGSTDHMDREAIMELT